MKGMKGMTWTKVGDFLDDWVVYAVTVGAVFFGPYVMSFQGGTPFTVDASWPRLALSALIALALAAREEGVPGPEAKAGRRKNLVRRLESAAYRGFTLSVLFQGGR